MLTCTAGDLQILGCIPRSPSSEPDLEEENRELRVSGSIGANWKFVNFDRLDWHSTRRTRTEM